ncbi:MAG TPA: transporter [Myxococcota bacterium]|nr:transporter [Myxococcota bacterium]
MRPDRGDPDSHDAGFLGLALACALLAADAAAQSFSADRPGISNPPHVLKPGEAQLEGGLELARETDGDAPNTRTLTAPGATLRVGVLPFLEARALVDGLIVEMRDGSPDRTSASDFALGARARLLDQSGVRPATALDFNLSLPTGSRAVSSDGVDPSGAFLFEWALPGRCTLDVNLGLGSLSLGAGSSRRAFQVAPSASLGVAIGERASAFVEYFATLSDRSLDDDHGVDAGFAWLAARNLQLDVSAGAGLSDAAPDYFVSVGAAWRFEWF